MEEQLKQFVQSVELMRIAQKYYFKGRTKEALERSKMYESIVDRFLIQLLHPDHPEFNKQQSLF